MIAANGVGIGLRTAHFREFLATRPDVAFVEVHSENFFGRGDARCGGFPAAVLERVAAEYPLSLHGVGLSLGSAEGIDAVQLRQLQLLVRHCRPQLVSDHLSWSAAGGIHANDLLPLPLTDEALDVVAANVARVQDALGRQLLIENPSRYLRFIDDTIDEPEFLGELVRRTGCGLLLDINNIHVSAANLGFDAAAWLAAIDADAVAEIHLAGCVAEDDLLLDTHSRPVGAAVWALYGDFIARAGTRPTLIEWDAELPTLSVLLGEAAQARRIGREAEVCDAVAS